MKKIQVDCLWSIGEICIASELPVLLFEDPDKSKTFHGIVRDTQIVLTLEEAKDLIFQLKNAVEQYEDLDSVTNAHDKYIED